MDTSTPLLKDSIHHDGKNGKPSCNAVIRQFLEEMNQKGEAPQFGGPWFNTLLDGEQIAVNMTRAAASSTDPRAYHRAEWKLREDMFRLVELLRGHYEEFRNCTILSSAVQAGVRESRQIKGLYTLTGQELLCGENFDDAIAYCAHPIDIHNPEDGGQNLHPLPNPGEIPFRALVPKEMDNLLAAGRCVSVDHEAHASVRVQATAMAMGEAAGAAAFLLCEKGCSAGGVSAEGLRSLLAVQGAVVPRWDKSTE